MDARDFFGYKHPDEEPGRRPEDEDQDDGDRPPQFEEAITLDDPAVIAKIDASNMLARVRELPRQLTQARRVAATVTLDDRHRDVDLVVVLGMGGSAIGAELVAGLAGDRLRVPLIVHRDYGLPAWVGPRTLVIAASHSGDTVETLSGAAEARRRGLPLVVASHRRGAGHGRPNRTARRSCATRRPGSRAPPSASASASSTSCSTAAGLLADPTRSVRQWRRWRACWSATHQASRPMRTRPSSWPGPCSVASPSFSVRVP